MASVVLCILPKDRGSCVMKLFLLLVGQTVHHKVLNNFPDWSPQFCSLMIAALLIMPPNVAKANRQGIKILQIISYCDVIGFVTSSFWSMWDFVTLHMSLLLKTADAFVEKPPMCLFIVTRWYGCLVLQPWQTCSTGFWHFLDDSSFNKCTEDNEGLIVLRSRGLTVHLHVLKNKDNTPWRFYKANQDFVIVFCIFRHFKLLNNSNSRVGRSPRRAWRRRQKPR